MYKFLFAYVAELAFFFAFRYYLFNLSSNIIIIIMNSFHYSDCHLTKVVMFIGFDGSKRLNFKCDLSSSFFSIVAF